MVMTAPTAQIYECGVMHRRLQPLQKSFSYQVFMLDVDLGALPEIIRRIPWLSHNRWNLFSIHDQDHIHLGPVQGIRENLTHFLEQQGHPIPPDTRIRLITFPRVLGYGFNPVSFYYLSKADGTPLFAVAEVVNTFREMKLYVIDEKAPDGGWKRRMPKDFYVSPFSDPGDSFDFRLGLPAEKWRVKIDDFKGDEKILVSAVNGQARPLTAMRLLGYSFKYPLLSLKIIGLIYWHALLLWSRKVPWTRKAARRDAQRNVLRPHKSLSDSPP